MEFEFDDAFATKSIKGSVNRSQQLGSRRALFIGADWDEIGRLGTIIRSTTADWQRSVSRETHCAPGITVQSTFIKEVAVYEMGDLGLGIYDCELQPRWSHKSYYALSASFDPTSENHCWQQQPAAGALS